jgi:hypothetical protein
LTGRRIVVMPYLAEGRVSKVAAHGDRTRYPCETDCSFDV